MHFSIRPTKPHGRQKAYSPPPRSFLFPALVFIFPTTLAIFYLANRPHIGRHIHAFDVRIESPLSNRVYTHIITCSHYITSRIRVCAVPYTRPLRCVYARARWTRYVYVRVSVGFVCACCICLCK